MSRLRFGLWVALFAMVLLAKPALAEALYWVVKNESQADMVELYVAESEAGLPDEVNLLGSQPLLPGEEIEIEIAGDRSRCEWITRIVFAGDGGTLVDAIDPCAQPSYLAALPQPAQDKGLVMVFENNSQTQVTDLRIAELGGLDAEPNILGGQPLEPGETISITLSKSGRPCVWDLHFGGADGSYSRESGIDFCASDTYQALGGVRFADGGVASVPPAPATPTADGSQAAAPPAAPADTTCNPDELGTAVGEEVMKVQSSEGSDDPLVDAYFERMKLAFTARMTGNVRVACAMYDDLMAATKDKRPPLDPVTLGYNQAAQPVAAQTPDKVTQFGLRVNLRNAQVSAFLNGLPVGSVSTADTPMSVVTPLVNWLGNGENSLSIHVSAFGDKTGPETQVTVFQQQSSGEPRILLDEAWTGADVPYVVVLDGAGLPNWAWQGAVDRPNAELEVKNAVVAFLDAVGAGDKEAFKAASAPLLSDLAGFMGAAMASQMAERFFAIAQAAAADGARDLAVTSAANPKYYVVTRADGEPLLKLPRSSDMFGVPPGEIWAFVDGAWRMVGLQ